MKPLKRRPRAYQLQRRQEKMDETRRRIADAIVALHEEVGPRATTVSAIAERAGVERLTVYRHFPDEAALLAGCSAHWAAAHPPPDPVAWAAVDDPVRRTARALAALYDYFEANERMLGSIHRDLPAMKELARVTQPLLDHLAQVAAGLAAAWRPAAAGAVLRVAVDFATWRTLHEAGAGDTAAKVKLVLAWLKGLERGV